MQLIVIEQRQQAIDRTAVQPKNQTGQNQRHGRHPFAPGNAEHQPADHNGTDHRRQLSGQFAPRQHPQRGNRQA
ncbi:hypothetical protein D3C81_1771970 [compost metagenome]